MSDTGTDALTYAGAGLATVGLLHFAIPGQIEPVLASAFPDDTRKHVFIAGGIETALGVGLAVRQLRKAAYVGLVCYAAYMGFSGIRNR